MGCNLKEHSKYNNTVAVYKEVSTNSKELFTDFCTSASPAEATSLWTILQMHLLLNQHKSLPFSTLPIWSDTAENIETEAWQAAAAMLSQPPECIELVEVLKRSFQTQNWMRGWK